MSRDYKSYAPIKCVSIDESGEAMFEFPNPCVNILECPGIYFAVSMDKSYMKCAGKYIFCGSNMLDIYY